MDPRHLSGAQVRQLQALRADGFSSAYTASVVGCADSTVRHLAPGWVGKVSVAPLRDAFLASGKSGCRVARSVGWFCTNSRGEFPDGSRVRRTLGLLPDVSGAGVRSWRKVADAETVALLAEAVGVVPWEVMPWGD